MEVGCGNGRVGEGSGHDEPGNGQPVCSQH